MHLVHTCSVRASSKPDIVPFLSNHSTHDMSLLNSIFITVGASLVFDQQSIYSTLFPQSFQQFFESRLTALKVSKLNIAILKSLLKNISGFKTSLLLHEIKALKFIFVVLVVEQTRHKTQKIAPDKGGQCHEATGAYPTQTAGSSH